MSQQLVTNTKEGSVSIFAAVVRIRCHVVGKLSERVPLPTRTHQTLSTEAINIGPKNNVVSRFTAEIVALVKKRRCVVKRPDITDQALGTLRENTALVIKSVFQLFVLKCAFQMLPLTAVVIRETPPCSRQLNCV